MISIKTWPLSRILLVCLAWVVIGSALFLWPFIKPLAQVWTEHVRIAATSFGIFSVLIRLAMIAIPPAVIFGIWFAGKSEKSK